jgi:ubiquitin carboxyl-terminal hydrolase 14
MKVNVKWGKELYSNIEIDTAQPPLIFKSQIFTLTGVPPDRQKVMIKGGLLKDDEWGKQLPKEGLTIMMMGSADAVKVEAPVNAPTFVEDLPEDEQDALETKQYGSGLTNLGNTCYMNSTVQCLYSLEKLREALSKSAAVAGDPNSKLVAATRELFKDLEKGGTAFPPFRFLMTLRERFPQFGQQTNEGIYMQQDAEECWTQVMYSLKEKLKVVITSMHHMLSGQLSCLRYIYRACTCALGLSQDFCYELQ